MEESPYWLTSVKNAENLRCASNLPRIDVSGLGFRRLTSETPATSGKFDNFVQLQTPINAAYSINAPKRPSDAPFVCSPNGVEKPRLTSCWRQVA
jgi:hypothetical protein